MKANLFPHFRIAFVMVMAAILYSGCNKYADFKDVVIVTGTDVNPLIQFTIDQEALPAVHSVTASATGRAESDITVHFQIDPSLVETYNETNATAFDAAPAASLQLSASTAVIPTGSNISNAVDVSVLSTEDFVIGRVYVIPVTITHVEGPLEVLDASRTIYLRIVRTMQHAALNLGVNWGTNCNNSFYYPYQFSENLRHSMQQFTFEMKVRVFDWHPGANPISRLCNWQTQMDPCGQEGGFGGPNLLRFGEHGTDIDQLQWVHPDGNIVSNTRFALERWYMISCTWDGQTYRLYVDGVLDGTIDGTPGREFVFGGLELGMSWCCFSQQRFLGWISEGRMWTRARSGAEIRESLCAVDPESNGLLAYWKFNEGEGQTFNDYTGHGYDMHWPRSTNGHWVSSTDPANICAQ